LETLRLDGLIEGMSYVLTNFTDDQLLVAVLRVILLMTQNGKHLFQNLSTSGSSNVQVAAKKILSLL
jgi:hypothetical protein